MNKSYAFEPFLNIGNFYPANRISYKNAFQTRRFFSSQKIFNDFLATNQSNYRLKDDKKVVAYLRDLVKGTHWDLEQLALTVY